MLDQIVAFVASLWFEVFPDSRALVQSLIFTVMSPVVVWLSRRGKNAYAARRTRLRLAAAVEKEREEQAMFARWKKSLGGEHARVRLNRLPAGDTGAYLPMGEEVEVGELLTSEHNHPHNAATCPVCQSA